MWKHNRMTRNHTLRPHPLLLLNPIRKENFCSHCLLKVVTLLTVHLELFWKSLTPAACDSVRAEASGGRMGSSASQLSSEEVSILVESSNFNRAEIIDLYDRFKKIDRDKTGVITRSNFRLIPELSMVMWVASCFLTAIHLSCLSWFVQNPLCNRIISMFDSENTDQVRYSLFLLPISDSAFLRPWQRRVSVFVIQFSRWTSTTLWNCCLCFTQMHLNPRNWIVSILDSSSYLMFWDTLTSATFYSRFSLLWCWWRWVNISCGLENRCKFTQVSSFCEL